MAKSCVGAADGDDEDGEFPQPDWSMLADGERIKAIYDQLKRRAGWLRARESRFLPHQTTSILNEVLARLLASGRTWKDEGHFLSTAAVAMRYYLIDQARRERNHGREDVDLDSLAGDRGRLPSHDDLVDLDLALQRLHVRDRTMAEIVDLKYFLGLTDAQTGAAVNLSEKSVERKWRDARVWLKNEIRRIRQSRERGGAG